jgi:hypothetical protein
MTVADLTRGRLTAINRKPVLLAFLGSPVCQLRARFRIQSAGKNAFWISWLRRLPARQKAAGSSPVALASFPLKQRLLSGVAAQFLVSKCAGAYTREYA